MNGINGIGGVNTSLYLAAGAMRTLETGIQVSAHNIANVSTANFLPQREYYTTGPGDHGVELATVMRTPKTLGGVTEAPNVAETFAKANSRPEAREITRPSGTDVAFELPHMISTQRAFEANAKTVTAADELLGVLLNTSA